MVGDTGIYEFDYFGRTDVLTAWNLSLQTQVDEYHQERHTQMSLLEFVEATCRVADHLIIPHFLKDPQFKSLEDFKN